METSWVGGSQNWAILRYHSFIAVRSTIFVPIETRSLQPRTAESHLARCRA